jgi:hypothetical protein
LSNDPLNIDKSFRQKFENFAPAPPDHIWEGVKADIATPVVPSFFTQNWKGLTIAAIVAALIISGIFLLKPSEKSVIKNDQISAEKEIGNTGGEKLKKDENQTNIKSTKSEKEEIQTENNRYEKVANESIPAEKTSAELKSDNQTVTETRRIISKTGQDKTKIETSKNFNYTAKKHENDIALNENLKLDNYLESKFSVKLIPEINNFELTKINNINITLNSNITPQLITPALNNQLAINEELFKKKGSWSFGLFLSPEAMLNNFDSVEVLTNYSLGIEPTYCFNDHLFIRFGLNATYSRDRGFADLDYLSFDLLGSYDYVYNITFDSIDGEVVPTYYTYKMDVWDTVRHLEINAITNNYYYIQTPLLIGYYKKSNNFKWYFYGGPAVNIMVSRQIDEPLKGVNYTELLNLQKKLPERSPYYFQVWVGAGIEFKANKNLGIAFEPNYRYYLNNVFSEHPYNKSGLSGFSIRFGLTYTIQ